MHDTCSCVVDEPVAISEVVDDEAVVCMYDLAVNEVMVMRQWWIPWPSVRW